MNLNIHVAYIPFIRLLYAFKNYQTIVFLTTNSEKCNFNILKKFQLPLKLQQHI